ncbi:HsdM family class I SAM-dependent methyltransferase [Kozakia baliensis]|uniref:HsdM family class I SAM-dependent methyltransferase n=1 Tax=Kozakia baliensis TaxID=153496 RepID=UPI000A7E153C|nr:N-6 DNA methylase [Kozakia baliensis]
MPKKNTDKNERNTENLVRNALRELDYYDEGNNISVEEQKSVIDEVKRLLKNGSKSSKGGRGYPEFLISNADTPDFLIIYECKASLSDHESTNVASILADNSLGESEEDAERRIKRYAVDGALHYAKLLSRGYNVIAVAVSGEKNATAKKSVYLYSKGAKTARPLLSKGNNKPTQEILPWKDFLDHAVFDPAVRQARLEDLMAFARELHAFMRDYAKFTESEKPLLVSGTLIGLQNKAFAASYGLHDTKDLPKKWIETIKHEIDRAEIPQAKKDNMAQPYASISVHPELAKKSKEYPKGILHELIKRIHEKAAPLMTAEEGTDILGHFYGEFLKYTGGDKKALGIVLTPRHITELFALLANVNKKSTVLDICAGTGGFLVSAMSQMMREATTEQERTRIKSKSLIGIEQQPNMFALAASNMILRGDGKANLYQGSCFDDAIATAVKKHKADVGLLNPPFAQGTADLHELRFIQQMLAALEEGGTGVAIVPMGCAIAPNPLRQELMAEHTLEAVMSMPTELFYPVGVVCCIMVWTAHKPHAQSKRDTWFGYWKEDGFIKTKHKGRIDAEGGWPALRDHWVDMYRNRRVKPGESVLKAVKYDNSQQDEWCAEAYMETDYSALTEADFQHAVRKYLMFQLVNEAEEKARAAAGGEGEEENE